MNPLVHSKASESRQEQLLVEKRRETSQVKIKVLIEKSTNIYTDYGKVFVAIPVNRSYLISVGSTDFMQLWGYR